MWGVNMTDDKTEAKDKKPIKARIIGRSKTKDYPVVPLVSAIGVSEAINKCGGIADSYDIIGNVLNVRGGALNNRITAARRYGLIEKDRLVNTELANKILKPIEPGEDENAKKEAILSVDLFRKLFQRFGNKLPQDSVFQNILVRGYGVSEASVGRTLFTIRKNFELLGDNADILETSREKELQSPNEPTSILMRDHPQFVMQRDKGNVVSITSKYGSFRHDVTDEIDWVAISNYIETLKKKWEKEQLQKTE